MGSNNNNVQWQQHLIHNNSHNTEHMQLKAVQCTIRLNMVHVNNMLHNRRNSINNNIIKHIWRSNNNNASNNNLLQLFLSINLPCQNQQETATKLFMIMTPKMMTRFLSAMVI